MFRSALFTAALAFSTPAMLLAQTAPSPDTIVVLDVSNSMWGQIGGVSKIEIAREVIADLVGDIDPNARFALVAYGHHGQRCANQLGRPRRGSGFCHHRAGGRAGE